MAFKTEKVVRFIVARNAAGNWGVSESGFEKTIAEFPEIEMAEQYALRLAESKAAWKVDVFDAAGKLTGTFNSEDDAMPKPAIT